MNKPIIDYLLENLSESGCTEAILAVNNLAEKIENYLGTEKYGIELHYNLEETPLGTGGPIKLAEKYLTDDDFLVLNGDILSFIDYKELIHFHKNTQTIATLTLKQVDDPSRYGVVRFGENDAIQEFVEKPKREEAPSNWINAGCYGLNPEILELIPGDRRVSIEREVFPKLTEKKKLKGYRYYGEWIDIGVPEDYLQANKMLQTNKCERASSLSPSILFGEGSKILDSIIWENTRIGKNTEITDSIVGSNCIIGNGVKIEHSVVADNVEIKDTIKIPKGTKIWPEQIIEDSIPYENQDIQ